MKCPAENEWWLAGVGPLPKNRSAELINISMSKVVRNLIDIFCQAIVQCIISSRALQRKRLRPGLCAVDGEVGKPDKQKRDRSEGETRKHEPSNAAINDRRVAAHGTHTRQGEYNTAPLSLGIHALTTSVRSNECKCAWSNSRGHVMGNGSNLCRRKGAQSRYMYLKSSQARIVLLSSLLY